MIGRLAGGRAAVMAGIACALNNALGCPVLEIGGRPADVPVTGVTGRRGGNMGRRFSGRPSAGTVTGCTIARRAAEQALSMAGFAVNPGVGAIQKEARRIVIEGCAADAAGSQGRGRRQIGNERGQH